MMSVRKAEFPASSMASLLFDVFFGVCVYIYIYIYTYYKFNNKNTHTQNVVELCCGTFLQNISEVMRPSRANMHSVPPD